MQSTNYVPFDALCYFIRVQEKEPLSPPSNIEKEVEC